MADALYCSLNEIGALQIDLLQNLDALLHQAFALGFVFVLGQFARLVIEIQIAYRDQNRLVLALKLRQRRRLRSILGFRRGILILSAQQGPRDGQRDPGEQHDQQKQTCDAHRFLRSRSGAVTAAL